MKAAFDYLVVLFAVALLSACGGRERSVKQTTAYVGGDGLTNRVVTLEIDSSLRAMGQKVDLKGVNLTESYGGQEGWNYNVGLGSAGVTPQSAYAPYAVQALGAYRGLSIPPPTPPDLDDRLKRLEESWASLERIAEALENQD